MIRPLERIFGRKESQARRAIAVQSMGKAVSMPRNYEKFAEEGYQKQVIAFRCINYIADAVAGMELILYKKGIGRRARTEITDHPILNLLYRPNPLQGREAFMRSLVGHLMISGNNYTEGVAPDGKAQPQELWPLRPDRMKVVPGANGIPSAYQHKVNSQITNFPVDILGRSRVMHLKSFHPTSDWYGMSPMEAAAMGIDILNEGSLWNLALLQNSARPSGCFSVEADANGGSATLPADQREQLRNDIRNSYQGARNAGTPMLLEGGLNWQPMGFNPVDMEYLGSKKTNSSDVALAFGVPGQLVGIEGSQTFANYEQARLAFYTETAIPCAKFILGGLNNWLTPLYDQNLYLAIDEDSIAALEPLRREKWEKIEKSQTLTVNEKREMLGMEPYKTSGKPGDQILVSSSMIPLEIAVAADAPLTDTSDLETEDSETEDDPESEPQETEPETSDDSEGNEEESSAKTLASPAETKERARRLAWIRQVRKMKSFEKALASQMEGHFNREAKQMASELAEVSRDLHEFTVNSILDNSEQAVVQILKKNIRAVLKEFGEQILEEHGKGFSPAETKDARDRFDQFVDRFLGSELVNRVKRIGRTTKSKVLKKVREVVSDTTSEIEVASRIRSTVLTVYASFSKARAQTIARTEVHSAAMEASQDAARQLRIPDLKKEWIASPDERTRDSHRDLNGTKIGLHEKFQVPYPTGVDSMDGPGDKSASLDNLINCRCVLTYSSEASNAE